MNAADVLIGTLKNLGVTHIFGYPGGAALPLYRALSKEKTIKHILSAHEQGAAIAACGYARATGKPGVVLVTSGPGITNAITGIHDAYSDSIPLICIAGQVRTDFIGHDAFQESDALGLTAPCTKTQLLINNVKTIEHDVTDLFNCSLSDRPGPTYIEFPIDIQLKDAAKQIKPSTVAKEANTIDIQLIIRCVEMIKNASRPVIIAGGGLNVSRNKNIALLNEFITQTQIPITATMTALGICNTDRQEWLGWPGIHGTYEANKALHASDLILSIGARFADRVTSDPATFAPHAKIIHVNIASQHIGMNVPVDLAIHADAHAFLVALTAIWNQENIKLSHELMTQWWQTINQWRKEECMAYPDHNEIIMPQSVIQTLGQSIRQSHKETIITTDVGNHQIWTCQYIPYDKRIRLITSGGLGAMGFGLPAAIGCQIANPHHQVICISGDGSIMMNIQELATIHKYKLPIKIFILNNQWLGMVKQWQEFFYDDDLFESHLDHLPQLDVIASSFGIDSHRISKPSELKEMINLVMKNPRASLTNIHIHPDEHCYPMIKPGKPHCDMILRPPAQEK